MMLRPPILTRTDHLFPYPPPFCFLRLASLLDPACAAPDAARLEQLRQRHVPLPPASVLVTGANGFLGSALLEALRARGTAIRILVRRPPPAGRHGADVPVVVGDLGDPDIVSPDRTSTRLNSST